jgi:exonuclease SbcC
MIPVKLTIKGMYSYQKEQILDFSNLIAGQIFGIFGSVGSGKSTILEAMSFALYGETERLHQRDNRNYNMMNLKSNDFLIDFVFKTGTDHLKYRFVVTAKRNNKRFDDVKTFERKAYKKNNGNWEPIDNQTAEELIGLSYTNFRRTIIIPQGKFQEFLQLGDKDRTEMLKEIFQLDRFDLFKKTASIEKKNNEERKNIQGMLTQLGEITLTDVQARESELKKLEENKQKSNNELEIKRKIEREQEKLKEIFNKLKLQKEDFNKLTTQKPLFEELEKRINKYEYCQIHFKSLFEKMNEQNEHIKELSEGINIKKGNLSETTKALQIEERNFEQVKETYNNRDKLYRQAEELEKILDIQSIDKKLLDLEEEIKKGNETIKENNETLKILHENQNTISIDLKQKKNELPDQIELSKIKAWFTTRNLIVDNINKTKNEIISTEKVIDDLKSQILEVIPADLIIETGINLKHDSIENILKTFEKNKEDYHKQFEQFESTEKELLIKKELEEIADNLKEGAPCPVCGSKEHPDMLRMDNIKQELLSIQEQINTLKDREKLVSDSIDHLKKLLIQTNEQQKLLEKFKHELTTENVKLQKHETEFKWKNYSTDNENAVDEYFDKSKNLSETIKRLENELESIVQKIDKKNDFKDKANKRLIELKNEETEKASKRKTLLNQINILKYDNFEKVDKNKIKEDIQKLVDVVKNVEQQFKTLEDTILKLNQQKNTLAGQILENEKQLQKTGDNLLKIEVQIKHQLDKSKYDSINEVQYILKSTIDIENEKERLEAFNRKLHSSKEQLNKYENEAEGKTFDEVNYNQLKEQIASIEETLKNQQERIGSYKENINKLKDDLKQKKELEKKLEKIELRAQDIGTLKQLFKGNGFVNYISSVYLQDLCNAANDRFYNLTRKRLRLELTENNNFHIRDFLNDGKIRSVKTLSGGQTFQASLSLALSLAESVQQQSRSKQNIFFLDEGFGTLDKESLQIVFDTLKSLRKEDRIVGVISHVEELQQEIDVYLMVNNDSENGSILNCSWEVRD